MEYSCIRQTELPSTTKLFADHTYHPERVTHFYPHLPLGVDSFRRAADQIHFSPEQRSQLISAFQVQNAGNPLLENLSDPRCVAVVTGQQVGLFSGPAYTIYKALTAVRVAEQLTAGGIPAVPMFWLATEDHDFPEINHAWLTDAEAKPECFAASTQPVANQPVGGILVGDLPFDRIHHALAPLPFGEEAFSLIHDTYRADVTFGDAFRALMDKLLEGFPILKVDPMLPAFRKLAAPLLREAVLHAPALTSSILERNQELAENGYHTQVHFEKSTSLVFLLRDGQRLALRRQNGNYLAGKESISAADLADRAEDLSPNALLRPVVEDSMIPTVAYVGGPAELAYFAQSEVLYRQLLRRQPVALHRASFTILSHRQRKLVDRYHLELPDFFHGEQSLREKAARVLVDPKLVERVADTRRTAVSSLKTMAFDLEHFDRSARKGLEKSRRKIEYQFDRIEAKVRRETIARDERASRDLDMLFNQLLPRHRLQERIYSGVSLVAQFGLDFASKVFEHLTLECLDHQVLTL